MTKKRSIFLPLQMAFFSGLEPFGLRDLAVAAARRRSLRFLVNCAVDSAVVGPPVTTAPLLDSISRFIVTGSIAVPCHPAHPTSSFWISPSETSHVALLAFSSVSLI